MPVFKHSVAFLALFVTFCGIPAPAEAIRIKNRDEATHQVVVIASGQERVIELPPGKIFTTQSPAATLRLITGGHRSRHAARFADEYIIWPGGMMHLQKRRWPEHRAFD